MDSVTLSSTLDIVAPALGQTLSVDQKAAIETSLVIKQSSEKLHGLWFWGRVNGLEKDYLVAQGVTFPFDLENFTHEKKFYSTDGTKWDSLPPVTDESATRCARIAKPFSGAPATATWLLERGEAAPPAEDADAAPAEVEDEGEPAPEGFMKVKVTELDRLAFAVKSICEAAQLVPRGASMLDANDVVMPNAFFMGLSGDAVSNPASYLHWRPTANPKTVVKLGDAASDSLDFLDSIADDVPKGCWSMQMNSTSSAMVLRHLVWPGAVSYAVVGHKVCGFTYFGNGLPNQDIAFML